MKTELRIAWRYLFAKKSHNAINIISGVSAAAVGVVTAAMICVLSVMNGFSGLVEQLFSAFDPEFRIVAKEGASFQTDADCFQQIRQLPQVEVYAETVVSAAMLQTADKQVPAIIKGCDKNFRLLTDIDSLLTEGEFSLSESFQDTLLHTTTHFERCIVGMGLAEQLGVGATHISGVQLYAPRRTKTVSMLRPEEGFKREMVFTAGVFAVNQIKYDDAYVLVSLPLARSLFEYADDEATAVELKLKAGSNIRKQKKQIAAIVGEAYKVEDRYEQQADFFKIMKIEKLLTLLLLVFILLIAAFNIVGSLSMLMIDKQADRQVLRTLGADSTMLQRIFLYEGWLISLIGAAAGMLIGLGVCLLQQHLGLLTLGSGTEYIISAYPVRVQITDVVLTLFAVTLIGWLAAWIPSRKIR